MSLSESLKEGDLFAGYTILRLLGSGGMGQVYLAQHPRLPRRDALKVLPATLTADDEYRQRFSREADLAARLWHPHIVGIHDRGEFEGQLWISMDYVEGTDASEMLKSQPKSAMPVALVTEIVAAVADALDYAHSRGLLHRDVKPANILLGDDSPRGRRIMLADFGIARQLGDISGLTATNMMIGTAAYCAPEQLSGADIDGRADQYALGCTAFHLLTGSAPFHNSNAAVVITQHLSAPPPRIGEQRPELAYLDEVLVKALAKDANDRYPSCSDFAAALSGKPRAADPNAASTQLAPAVDGPTQLAPVSETPATEHLHPPPASTPAKAPRRALRPAALITAVAVVVLIAVATFAGTQLLGRHASRPDNDATSGPPAAPHNAPPPIPPPNNMAPPGSAPIQLARYITDQSEVLGPAERAAVDVALNRLYNGRGIHLWVVYVNNFSGLMPLRWAEQTMRANGFSQTDALLAIATDDQSFSFRVPGALVDGTAIDIEAIRRNRIEPAVRRGEWTRAAIAAANGLETVAGQ